MADHGLFHTAQLLKALDIAHFKVHAGILVQMPCRIVFFRPEHRPDLKHPFIYAHHHLLVKLGALRQIGLLPEIVQPENIGSALRALADQLRGMDLYKILLLQKFRKASHQRVLDPEYGPLPLIAQGQRPVVQYGLQRGRNLFAVNDHGHAFRRHRQNPDAGGMQLPARPGAGFLHRLRFHADAHFLLQRPFPGSAVRPQDLAFLRLQNALDQLMGRAQDEEGKAAHLPQPVDASVHVYHPLFHASESLPSGFHFLNFPVLFTHVLFRPFCFPSDLRDCETDLPESGWTSSLCRMLSPPYPR